MVRAIPAVMRRSSWEIWLLIALSLPLLFYGLGSYSVVNGDEAFYHYVSREMLRSGDWLRLEFTGEHRIYDTMMNAPLQYWLRAALIAAFGDSPWTMRGLSALSALASVLMTFLLGRRLGGRGAGLVAALMQLTTYQFVYLHSARTGEMEPAICLLFTLVAWLFLDGVEGRRGFAPHHLAVMLLANLKMPLFVLPLVAEALYFLFVRESRQAIRSYLRLIWLLPLGFVWHLWHLLSSSPAVWGVLQQMKGEASGSGLIKQRDSLANLAFHLRNLFTGAFPWSLLFVPGLIGLLSGVRASRKASALLLIYPLTILGFYVAVAKSHPWYVIPLYPFLAIATAIGWPGFVELLRGRLWPVVALLGTLVFWLEYRDANPFARRAVEQLSGLPTWRAFGDAPAWLLPLTLALMLGVVFWARRSFGARGVAVGMIAVALAGAGWRVLVPLQSVDHRSSIDRQHRSIVESRRRGEPLELPIPIRQPGAQLVRYYFADEFRIVRSRERGVFFWLVAEGETIGDPPLGR